MTLLTLQTLSIREMSQLTQRKQLSESNKISLFSHFIYKRCIYVPYLPWGTIIDQQNVDFNVCTAKLCKK